MAKIGIPGPGQIYHGVHPGSDSGDESNVTAEQLRSYECTVGRQAAWVYFSHEWSKGSVFPTKTVDWIHWQGAAPFIRLMLRSSLDNPVPDPKFTLDAIISGGFDCELRAWGRAARERGFPLICEWGTEMNGDQFAWTGIKNGGEPGTKLFKQAFRHIVTKVRDGGGTNITWVFHADSWDDDAGNPWNVPANYDPGCEFSDWIGLSLYGAQAPGKTDFPVFSKQMDKMVCELTKLEGNRPIMICEFGFAKQPNGPQQATSWTQDALDSLLSNRWPSVRGFSWWNERWEDEKDKTISEMRVEAMKEVATIFKAKLAHNKNVIDRPLVG